ncbi:hypothetical protein FRC06_001198 [Ceratobasidium sp. 370]|nr:hypothetical protein FRC06_001198 [Ceratobasidium sp. 370]
MSWQTYVDTNLVGSGKVTKAAILGQQGGVWATSPGFELKPQEQQHILKIFSNPDAALGSGVTLAGVKYFALNAEPTLFLGKKAADGCIIAKTTQAILVTVHEAPTQMAESRTVVEVLAQYLHQYLGLGQKLLALPDSPNRSQSTLVSSPADHSQCPIDFISNSPKLHKLPQPDHGDEGLPQSIDDAEWELRVGRAISILSRTLPDFFKNGLTTRFDHDSGTFALVEAVHPPPDLIYAKNIRLRYAPPERLPAPFPETLQIEGLPLYFASAAIVRTSLNTLYHDMHLALKSVEVSSLGHRERKFQVGFIVTGSSRVGESKTEWDIINTYQFSRNTGLINQHDVNSIHPAPHSTVYDALQSSLQKLGLLSPRPPAEPVPRVDVGCVTGQNKE